MTPCITTSSTTDQLPIGKTAETGTIPLGRPTASQTLALGGGVTATGNTNTIQIGTAGASGSTTAITLGGTANTSSVAVNGTLSATGILSGPGFRASKTTATSGLVKIQDEGANTYNVIGSRNNADSAALPLNFQASNFDFNGAVAVTGALSSTTGANFATSSGNVGIGTTSPAVRLDVSASANQTSQFISSGNYSFLRIGHTGTGAANWDLYTGVGGGSSTFGIANSGGTRLAINSAGSIQFNAYGAGALTTDASGNVTAVSDERIKSNIRPFSRGLTEILAINPILHGYTEESGLDQSRDDYAGFSAQQVQTIIPEAIDKNANGMLSFSDRPVMAALVNAMKELNANLVAQVEILSQRLAALETK